MSAVPSRSVTAALRRRCMSSVAGCRCRCRCRRPLHRSTGLSPSLRTATAGGVLEAGVFDGDVDLNGVGASGRTTWRSGCRSFRPRGRGLPDPVIGTAACPALLVSLLVSMLVMGASICIHPPFSGKHQVRLFQLTDGLLLRMLSRASCPFQVKREIPENLLPGSDSCWE